MSQEDPMARYRKWLENKDRLVHKHLLIDRELYKEINLIAVEKFGTGMGKVYLIVNEALEEYVRRHRHRDQGGPHPSQLS
jgi:hypothetical protein